MTQNDRLIEYLGKHPSISTLEAMSNLGICRLSERIRELEKEGMVFNHQWEKAPNGKRVFRYRLMWTV